MEDSSQVLTIMKELELCFAELYRAASQIDSSRNMREFWLQLSYQEEIHAEYVGKMMEAYSEAPEKFEIGRQFNAISLKTWISEIKATVSKVKNGEIDPRSLLSIASDYEDTLMEKNCSEYLNSADVEYTNLMNKIMAETRHHREMLENKIKEIENRG